MRKTIHHRDTETQRKAKAKGAIACEWRVCESNRGRFSLCLCVSVVQGVV